ncbi:hypothetical protein EP073_07005 [Geovibrio thiophilus]|uniref:Uncharacterized protein n=1 Tax=Geovibrio thiophilus TaxID=139438 RepID=A0A3R5X2T2_9BACT|nr:hypothetical protein [Geovibrio thiophilus]QAR33156.1 hypothetical protein EP073_07005 [Geovibrio thiophilus]
MDKEKRSQEETEETEELEARKKFAHDSSCCSDVDLDEDAEEKEDPSEQAKKRSNYGNYKHRHGSFEDKVHNTGEKMGDWLKESYEKGKEEVLRLTKIAKIKLDIVALKKKKDERLKLLGKKAIELVKEGYLEVDMIEPEYSMIKSIEAEIADKNLDITDIKKKTKEQPAAKDSADSARKAIEAKSIPLDDKDDE